MVDGDRATLPERSSAMESGSFSLSRTRCLVLPSRVVPLAAHIARRFVWNASLKWKETRDIYELPERPRGETYLDHFLEIETRPPTVATISLGSRVGRVAASRGRGCFSRGTAATCARVRFVDEQTNRRSSCWYKTSRQNLTSGRHNNSQGDNERKSKWSFYRSLDRDKTAVLWKSSKNLENEEQETVNM